MRAPRTDQDPPRPAPRPGLCRLPEDRRRVGAPSRVSIVRPRRVLRFLAEPSRDEALPRVEASARDLGRARRDVDVVLRRRALPVRGVTVAAPRTSEMFP